MIDLNRLANSATIKKFETDEVLFNEGDPGHEMMIILSGKLEISINSVDGFPIILANLGAGDLVGEMSLLEGLPRSATVRAIEQTIAAAIDEINFEKVIAEQPVLAVRMMKGLSKRVRDYNEEMRFLRRGSSKHSNNEDDTSVVTLISDSGILRKPGKIYGIGATDDHEIYLFDKRIECPVCDKLFDVKMLRNSRLKLQKVDPDFRQRYEDIEPMWYMPFVCPHCLYADLNTTFNQVSDTARKSILKESPELRKRIDFSFSQPRTIDQVLMAYYLVLHWLETTAPDANSLAKVWLRLAWLYRDLQEEEPAHLATDQAYEYFKQTYEKGRGLSQEQEQRLAILLGELSLAKGELKTAYEYLSKAVLGKEGNAQLNRQASDRLMDIKQAMKSSPK
ncbi:MAG: DUF2225 domain-containing protein [Acidobacteriota bacterium]